MLERERRIGLKNCNKVKEKAPCEKVTQKCDKCHKAKTKCKCQNLAEEKCAKKAQPTCASCASAQTVNSEDIPLLPFSKQVT